jgi:6-phosphogluconolactonase (cycloisomerase 2 family)
MGGTASAGSFFFVANSEADSISEFSMDPTSGALAQVGPPVTAGRGPAAIAATPDNQFIYVSNAGSNDVSAFAINPVSGALTAVSGSPFAAGANPKAVAVYAASSGSSRLGSVKVFWHWYLFVANAGSANVSVYTIDQKTGVLTPLPAPYATGINPSAMAVRTDGQFLYIASMGGANDISAFSIDLSGGLRAVAGSPFTFTASGSPFPLYPNVNSLAFGAGEAFAYAANASSGTASILGFRIEPFGTGVNSGALTALPGFPDPLPSCNFVITDQRGNYLYATAGTNVFGFRIDQQAGTLSPLPGSPVTAPDVADSMSIDSSNRFLYVTNRTAGRIAGFQLNATTGELTAMPGSPFAIDALTPTPPLPPRSTSL